MLVRLTKPVRSRAAALLALLYALCVVGPASAFAFGDGTALAHCLTEDGLGLAHVHGHDAGKIHVHNDGTVHHHHLNIADDKKSPAKHDHKHDQQCCGLFSVSALAAPSMEILVPATLGTRTESIVQAHVAGHIPDGPYRPPSFPLSL